jgi:glycosyltransferase involved in cell wall biosynthesis
VPHSRTAAAACSATVIIPSYHEAQRLPPFLAALCRATRDRPEVKIVVCDDGSAPAQRAVVERAVAQLQALKPGLELRALPVNQGKGGALAHCARAVTTDLVGFVDADGSVTADECLRLLDAFTARLAGSVGAGKPVEAMIGSRVKMLGTKVDRQVRRHFIGRVFATLLANMFKIPVYDSQCGCKFFRREALAELLPHAYDKRWLWDTQVVLLFFLTGRPIVEFPISWHETPGSKVSLVKDPVRMFTGLARFRRYLRLQEAHGVLRLPVWRGADAVAGAEAEALDAGSGDGAAGADFPQVS